MSDMHIDELKKTKEGKEHTSNLETPVEEKNIEEKANLEKTTAAKTAEGKEEAPKKKKNIIRVYHAQNASDGGRRRRPEGARPVRPAAEGADKPARPAGSRPARPAADGTEKPVRPAGTRPVRSAADGTEKARPQAARTARPAAEEKKTSGVKKPEEAKSEKIKDAQTRPAAAETKPAEPKAAEVKISEQKTAPAKSAEAKEKEVKQAETRPGETKSAETKSAETKSSETKSVETKSVETKQAEAKPAETKAAESVNTAADSAPGKSAKDISAAEPQEKAAPEGKAAAHKNEEVKPAESKNTAAKNAEPVRSEEKPAETRSAESGSAETKSADEKAAAHITADSKPAEAKTAAAESTEQKNADARTQDSKSSDRKPAYQKPDERKPQDQNRSRTPRPDQVQNRNQAPRQDGERRQGYRTDNRTDSRTDGRSGDYRGDRRDGTRPQGQSMGQNRGPRMDAAGRGQGGRFTDDKNRTGGFRSQEGRDFKDNRTPRDNRDSKDGRTGLRDGRTQSGQNRYGEGRPQGGFSEGRNTEGTSRFGTGTGRPQNKGTGGKRSGDTAFIQEMTKSSKDSKRERDRENKNKKKDFQENQQQNGRRPNQQGTGRPGGKNAKSVSKPVQQPKVEEKKPEIKEITIPEKLTIRELAEAMKIQASAIVKKLFMEGIMVTVNNEIDFEKAQEIALEYDIIAEKEETVDVIEELLKEGEEDESKMVPRPPVVCVMGHVDHGKTSLLDRIRNSHVTEGEAGGITQHIGAYVVEINGQKITFLDTPGHEAFTAMRMRGANATDIAVLVVAADDGVMPQTVEAISHARAAGVEIIVAINKIDKPGANIDRVKQELSEQGLIPEDWGGNTVFTAVSAKTGEGIDNLLEMILLTAEVAELKANPNRDARGLVIEAQLDKGRGPVATILVQKGTLHVGDFIAAGATSGKVRAMMDDKGRRVKEALPSTPVEILGLGDVPNAGEVLMSFHSDKEAKNFAGAFVSENKNRLLEETKGKLSLDNLFDQIQASDLKELPIIVKADVQGSVEAVKQSLVKLSNEEVVVKVIHGGVGAINESDVTLAATSNAIIIGFNVRPDPMAKQLAEQEKVDMRLYKVIYQAIEDVEAAMKGLLDPVFEEKVIGHAEVRQLFKASGIGTIAGSYILDGVFQRNCHVRITREGEQIYEGDLASLKRFKDDVKEVRTGFECGLVFSNFNDVKEEDKVEAYIMVEVPR